MVERPERAGAYFNEIEPGAEVELAWARSGKSHKAEVLRVRPGYMGVAAAEVDAEIREEHDLAHGEGLVLSRVVPDGPSEEAGLLGGDIVLRMGGRPVDDRSLTSRLAQRGGGAEVVLDVLRDGERIEVLLTTGERPRP